MFHILFLFNQFQNFMKKLSGRLGNRVTQWELLFQGWHVNKVPANHKKKQNSFKNKNFHGPISMYTLTGLALEGAGV